MQISFKTPVQTHLTVEFLDPNNNNTVITNPTVTANCTVNDPSGLAHTCVITTNPQTFDFTATLGNVVTSLASQSLCFRLVAPSVVRDSISATYPVSNVPPVLPASAVTTVTNAPTNLAPSEVIDLTPYVHKDWTLSVIPSSVTDPNGGAIVGGTGVPTATVQGKAITIQVPPGYGAANVSASAVLANPAGSSVVNVTGNNFFN